MSAGLHPRVAQAVLMLHRDNPMDHDYGWAIVGQGARELYLTLDDAGRSNWTPDRRQATLFTSRLTAERRITNCMTGSAKAVALSR